jgi:eukaryotic-like serine/threonine-protein kinase
MLRAATGRSRAGSKPWRPREHGAEPTVIRESFVGRDREIAELRSGLNEALYGRGALFMIGGESGIGKTRLADELAADATQRGALVVWGSAWEGGGAPPFWPWVQVVRELVGGLTSSDRPRLREILAASAPYVAQLVPAVRDALPDLPPTPALESEQARFGLFDAIATFLRDRASERPLVLVLEDLHWADEPSLLLTEFLARTLRNAPLLALATYRDVDATRLSRTSWEGSSAPPAGSRLEDWQEVRSYGW